MDTEYIQEHPNAMVSQKYSCSGANCFFYHIEISSDNSKATVRQLLILKQLRWYLKPCKELVSSSLAFKEEIHSIKF